MERYDGIKEPRIVDNSLGYYDSQGREVPDYEHYDFDDVSLQDAREFLSKRHARDPKHDFIRRYGEGAYSRKR